ncbi:MAG: triose-phosphate isomerase [Nonlabens sp.]
MRKKIVAGNWKMNCDLNDTRDIIWHLHNDHDLASVDCDLMIAPSSPFLLEAYDKAKSHPMEVIAQDVNENDKGAHTGETSVEMLKSISIKTVIIGHSERRDTYGDSDERIAAKVKTAIAGGLKVIFCCGEHLDKRQSNQHVETIANQIDKGLFQLSSGEMKHVVIAYEPVWAIGTGETASPQQAQEMHASIRKQLHDKYGEQTASDTSILYGGSVKPANAKEIFSQPDVDGGLVGGASLDPKSFFEIASSF